MEAGKFIVLEGVDGAGTTTHTKLLADRLRDAKLPVRTTAEPSAGPVGALLRLSLTGRVVAGAQAPGWNTLALLFAADRLDHLDVEILPNLRDGVNVICDRYDYSSVAYQSVAGDGPDTIGWIRELNRYSRRPDLAIVLDVSPEVAADRRRRRHGSDELFDRDALQRELCAFYAD